MKHAYLDLCREPDFVLFQYEDSGVRFEEPSGREEQSSRVDCTPVNGALRITLYPSERPYQRVKLRFEGDLSAGILMLGDGWERTGLSTVKDAEALWTGMHDRRKMPWYFHLFDGRALHSYGVKTGPACFAYFECDVRGITLWLDVRSGGVAARLTEPLVACELVSRRGEEGADPFREAQAFCRMLCDRPNLPTEPIFGVNNWYWAYGDITHESVMTETDQLMEMTRDAACRPYMILDDGWQLNRYSNRHGSYNGGPWDSANAGFPDGMAATAEAIHEKGAKAGIWVRPLLTCLPVPAEEVGIRKMSTGFVLDPSHPAVLEKVASDIALLRAQGYDLIKHDFSTYDTVGRLFADDRLPAFYDKTKPSCYILRELYRTIEKAAGGAAVIGCNTIGHLVAGIHAAQRAGDDTSGRNFEVTRSDGVASLVRLPQNNTFFSHDPDCAAFTDMVSEEMNLDFLEAAAITGATTLASVTPGVLSREGMARIRRIFATASKGGLGAEPTDWLGHNIPSAFRCADGKEILYNWYREYHGVRTYYQWSN